MKLEVLATAFIERTLEGELCCRREYTSFSYRRESITSAHAPRSFTKLTGLSVFAATLKRSGRNFYDSPSIQCRYHNAKLTRVQMRMP